MSPRSAKAAPRPRRLSPEAEARFWDGVAYRQELFMGQADVQSALAKLTCLLETVLL